MSMSSIFHQLLVVVITAQLYISSHGYPTGAPDSICGTLQPSTVHHAPSAQSSDSPYTLTVSSDSVASGQTVTVTVSGSDGLNLRGIFLQARASGETTALGSFTSFDSDNYKTVDCSSTTASGVTHSNRDDKAVPQTFTWTAPDDLNGEVQFVATIVQTTDTYWMNVMSSTVTVDSGNSKGSLPQFNWMQVSILLAMGLFLLVC